MNSTRVHDVLRQVTEQATKREFDLAAYATKPTADLDIKADAECPIFNSSTMQVGMNRYIK